MAHGFFTVEQWKRARRGPGKWEAVLHLDAYQSVTKAIAELEKRGQPGLYRVTQTQRCLWGEMEKGKLRLHGSHVESMKSLGELSNLFERERGRRPVEQARLDRAKAKAARSNVTRK